MKGGIRIIAGEWRGRRIAAPAGSTTRPTSDRARETAFSMLASRLGGFTGLRVADLFAGSGALGIEALSRGALSCLFVDRDKAAVEAIRANVSLLGCTGADISTTALPQLSPASVPFDLIFADPPYHSDLIETLLDTLIAKGWVNSGTMLCLESAVDEDVVANGWTLVADRKVGKACLRLLTPIG